MRWLFGAGLSACDIAAIPDRLAAGDCLLMVAENFSEDPVGVVIASIAGDTLRVEAVAGGPGVMRAAIEWAKAEVSRRGLRRALAMTAQAGVVHAMVRAGATLNAALLTWEA